ncbi:MAG TPA: CDP-alcohol phosphatidyltransferase family protein [Actinomycetales bacterium]|nr:CDP-alcohol phosphatidyltransferase family protein [Actinomycetales bacterium]
MHSSHAQGARWVQAGPVLGLAGTGALLVALGSTVGLARSGWLCGVAAAAVVTGLLSVGLLRAQRPLGPADRITLARAVLVCGVTALALSSPLGATRWTMVALAAVALVLDNVDGRVARRTGSASALGARFDMEVDALLILVLSIDVSRQLGAWVLLIGAARYLLLAAQVVAPWLRGPAPTRYWCKVVAAVEGVVLTTAAAQVVPTGVAALAVGIALALLAESFGREVIWLWRRRPATRSRRVPPWVVTASAAVFVWSALLAPGVGPGTGAWVLEQVPIEAVALLLLALVLPGRLRSAGATTVGAALAVLVLVHALDVGFELALGRPFQPLTDWTYARSLDGLLRQSLGHGRTLALLIATALAAVTLVVLLPLALRRLASVASRRRGAGLLATSVLAAVWTTSAYLGLEARPGAPVAAAGTVRLAVQHARQIESSVHDGRRFALAASSDPLQDVSPDGLLAGLHGKDVLFVFVESYGRVALEGPTSAPVLRTLDHGTAGLRASGYSARSGFLTSPTFGGISWLAHATLQSGMWVDTQGRYDALMRTDRMTLSRAFGQAGWRTVADVPSNRGAWPDGSTFYRYDKVYGGDGVGYAGPSFSYASMPDQYTLAAFGRLELDRRDRPPVMAEIDLVSSHTPWAPLPRMVPWDAVGNGSVFDPMPAQGQSPAVVWQHPVDVRRAYAQSIAYSLDALVSFVRQSSDPDLVVVALGDHQPATVVSGANASHDVPVSVIARDPAVLHRIAGWGWQPGLRPSPTAPVWPMDAFRDRFLAAFGSGAT